MFFLGRHDLAAQQLCASVVDKFDWVSVVASQSVPRYQMQLVSAYQTLQSEEPNLFAKAMHTSSGYKNLKQRVDRQMAIPLE